MSTGMTWFPMSPGAPRNNKGEAVEEFIAATCKVSKDLSKTICNSD